MLLGFLDLGQLFFGGSHFLGGKQHKISAVFLISINEKSFSGKKDRGSGFLVYFWLPKVTRINLIEMDEVLRR